MSRKLALPRFYLRANNVDFDMEDELLYDDVLINKSQEQFTDIELEQNKLNVEIDEAKEPTGKKRQPTQYNIFMKETMALLATTRPDLVGKERFKYSVYLWNEKKKALTATSS